MPANKRIDEASPSWRLLLADGISVLVSVSAALAIRFGTPSIPGFVQQIWPILVLLVTIRLGTLWLSALYYSARHPSKCRLLLGLTGGMVLGTSLTGLLTIGLAIPFGVVEWFPRSILVIELLLGIVMAGTIRICHWRPDRSTVCDLRNELAATSRNALQKVSNWQVFAVIIVASNLRLWGIGFGLPFLYHPDEPAYVRIALNVFRTGDLNPHFFNYPSLFFYLNALAYVPYSLAGWLLGVLESPSDVPFPQVLGTGVGKSFMPSQFLLGRSLTVILGVLAVVLVYAIGLQLRGHRAGLLAATLVAVSPTNVYNSHLITPDTFVTFFVLFSFFFSCRILMEGDLRDYALAGLGAGLAASCKYNGALVLLPLVVAHFLRHGQTGPRHKELYIALGLSALAFLLTTPFSLLDWRHFLEGARYEANHYSTGHPGMEGDTPQWYLQYLLRFEGPVIALSLLQGLNTLRTRRRADLLLLAFPCIYLAFISGFVVRNDRTLLPAIPFMLILAAVLVDRLIGLTATITASTRRRLLSGILLGAAAVLLLWPITNTISSDRQLANADGREMARIWIDSHLPAGARIAAESYSPYLDPRLYSSTYMWSIIDHTPDWFLDNGFDYLVLSEGMYGRFYLEPNRYPTEVAAYEVFFSSFPETASFDGNAYEVRVLRVQR